MEDVKERSLAGAIPSRVQCMTADRAWDVEVDLNIMCRWRVDLVLSRLSTTEDHRSYRWTYPVVHAQLLGGTLHLALAFSPLHLVLRQGPPRRHPPSVWNPLVHSSRQLQFSAHPHLISLLTLGPCRSRLHCQSTIFPPPSLLFTDIIFIHFPTRSSSFFRRFRSSPGTTFGGPGVRAAGPSEPPPNEGGGGGGGRVPLGMGDWEGSFGTFSSGAVGMRATRVSERLRSGSLTKPYLSNQLRGLLGVSHRSRFARNSRSFSPTSPSLLASNIVALFPFCGPPLVLSTPGFHPSPCTPSASSRASIHLVQRLTPRSPKGTHKSSGRETRHSPRPGTVTTQLSRPDWCSPRCWSSTDVAGTA